MTRTLLSSGAVWKKSRKASVKPSVSFFVLVWIVLAGGCGATMYAPPQGPGPRSLLTFHSNTDGVIIQVFADRSCTKLQNGVRVAYLHDRYNLPKDGAQATVESRPHLVLSASWWSSGVVTMRCTAAVEFDALPNAQYQVVYQRKGLHCRMMLLRDVVQEGQTFQEPDPTAKPLENPCFSGMD